MKSDLIYLGLGALAVAGLVYIVKKKTAANEAKYFATPDGALLNDRLAALNSEKWTAYERGDYDTYMNKQKEIDILKLNLDYQGT